MHAGLNATRRLIEQTGSVNLREEADARLYYEGTERHARFLLWWGNLAPEVRRPKAEIAVKSLTRLIATGNRTWNHTLDAQVTLAEAYAAAGNIKRAIEFLRGELRDLAIDDRWRTNGPVAEFAQDWLRVEECYKLLIEFEVTRSAYGRALQDARQYRKLWKQYGWPSDPDTHTSICVAECKAAIATGDREAMTEIQRAGAQALLLTTEDRKLTERLRSELAKLQGK